MKYIIEIEVTPYTKRVDHTNGAREVYKACGIDKWFTQIELSKLNEYHGNGMGMLLEEAHGPISKK